MTAPTLGSARTRFPPHDFRSHQSPSSPEEPRLHLCVRVTKIKGGDCGGGGEKKNCSLQERQRRRTNNKGGKKQSPVIAFAIKQSAGDSKCTGEEVGLGGAVRRKVGGGVGALPTSQGRWNHPV